MAADADNVIQFVPRPNIRRENFKFRMDDRPIIDIHDDLIMDHRDPGLPSDSTNSSPTPI